MKSIVVRIRTLGTLIFSSDVSANLHVRPALDGSGKHVALGFSLSRRGVDSDIIMLEPRLSALEICSNYKKMHARAHRKSLFCKGKAERLIEALPKLKESECSGEVNAQILERIAVAHLSEENISISFDPYSLEANERVEVFVHYRKHCLSGSVQIDVLNPFISQRCSCVDCVGLHVLQDAFLVDNQDSPSSELSFDVQLDLERLEA
jgi:hypothetical protein